MEESLRSDSGVFLDPPAVNISHSQTRALQPLQELSAGGELEKIREKCMLLFMLTTTQENVS